MQNSFANFVKRNVKWTFRKRGFPSLPSVSFLIIQLILNKMFYICCCILKCLKIEPYKFLNVVNLMVITIFCQNGCQDLINEPSLNAKVYKMVHTVCKYTMPFKECFLQ